MKTKYDVDVYRRAAITAGPGEYDGHPTLDSIYIDAVPTRLNKFRESAACALPYLPLTNGALETEKPLFPLTASQLRKLAPFEIVPTNIEWKPSDIPRGSGTLLIDPEQHERAEPSNATADTSDVAHLKILRSDTYNGALSTVGTCTTASNVWLLREIEGDDRYLLGLVAIGVLFSEDFDARQLTIITSAKFKQLSIGCLTRVLESVGLQLEIRNIND